MSGAHNGVQNLTKHRSSKPVQFVHCAAHNPVNDAVNSVLKSDNFFWTDSINLRLFPIFY